MFERRVAVLIGAAEYKAAYWANLHYVRKDIESPDGLQSILARDLGTCCFSPSDIHSRLGTFTHRENMAFLRELAHDNQFTRNTLLFLYFSGHGFIDKAVGNVPCLIMHNTTTDNPSGEGITFTWIRDEIIKKTKATVLLVIDSCFSGQIITDFDWSQEVVGDHFAIIASCAQDQESFGDPNGTQSFFTKWLITALQGEGLALENGIVDTNSIARFLNASCSGPNQYPQFRLPRTPFILSSPQCSISSPAQESFDESTLQRYLKRIRQVGAANQLLNLEHALREKPE